VAAAWLLHAQGDMEGKIVAKLSPVMQEALDVIKQHGHLIRWPGGYWTYDGVPVKRPRHQLVEAVPEWWCGISTVKALEKRGYVRFEGHRKCVLIEN
jgi:hypothetical protein